MLLQELNYAEAVLWFLFTLVIAHKAYSIGRKSRFFTITVIMSVAFIVFGISDLIEVHTGAWWRPFSLLVLKGGCICTFIGCYIKYSALKKSKY